MSEKNWVLKFAWTPTRVRKNKKVWFRPYYEAWANGARYRREKGQNVVYKANMAVIPEG